MTPEERAAIDAYLSNGGTINRIPVGHSGEVFQWDDKAGIIRTVTPIHKQKHFGFGNRENLAKANRARNQAVAGIRNAIRALHSEGKNNAEIGEAVGLDLERVRHHLKRMGLASNPMPNTPKGVGEEVLRLLNQGYTRREVSNALNVSISTVKFHDQKRRAA